ncbi:hypothetical protein SAMN02745220_04359 [Desulfopila aestuarii DSM 18488]|uniref:Uncharacterized protein n=1 Tax=Desulfopila aestuarii DSM 18488 TaxID=1121416 RepID=A0A1M7YHI2_9BACT|nr:hypothetical protein SAMN02745220_04359 [Desulfopila aestuarii DSM 18488]
MERPCASGTVFIILTATATMRTSCVIESHVFTFTVKRHQKDRQISINPYNSVL